MVVGMFVLSDSLTPKRFRNLLLAMTDNEMAAFLDGARVLVGTLRELRHVAVEVEAEIPELEPLPPND
jgi:hypothetical protein